VAKDPYPAGLGEVAMFSTCTKKELELVARRGEVRDVPAGKRLATEGQLGDEFFVIVSGTCEVSRQGSVVATLGPGQFFGELALLDRAIRDATVTAVTDVKVFVVPRRGFDELLIEVPSLTRKLLRGLARRLHALQPMT